MKYKTLADLTTEEYKDLTFGTLLLGMSGELSDFEPQGKIEEILGIVKEKRTAFSLKERDGEPSAFIEFLYFPGNNFQLLFIPGNTFIGTKLYEKVLEGEGKKFLSLVDKISQYEENFLTRKDRYKLVLNHKDHKDPGVPEQARLLYEAYLMIREYHDGIQIEFIR